MNILSILKPDIDKDYQKFQTKICHTNYKILGVKIPILRKKCKQLLKQYNYEVILNNLDSSYYEMIMIEGLIIGNINVQLNTRINLINNFLPKIDNWAICDIFVGESKWIKNNLDNFFIYLQKLLNKKDEFYLRFVIVTLLTYYINDEYYENVLRILLNIKSEYYYVNMAISWAYSILLIKYYDETIIFLKENQNKINKWIFNKSLQKARESYRINDKQKEFLKKLKTK